MRYLVLRRTLRPRHEWKVSLDEHLAWMERQHRAGNIIVSGPSADRQLGIYVIRADSREQAEKVAARDPFTVAGYCAFDLIEWDVHQILGTGPFSVAAQRVMNVGNPADPLFRAAAGSPPGS